MLLLEITVKMYTINFLIHTQEEQYNLAYTLAWSTKANDIEVYWELN